MATYRTEWLFHERSDFPVHHSLHYSPNYIRVILWMYYVSTATLNYKNVSWFLVNKNPRNYGSYN
jgi:hypothetical protein